IKLLYWSEDSQGRPERQSGLLCLPESRPGSALKVPLLLLCHGTMVLRERVPSRQAASECVVAQVAAATGIAVVLPDYPGLGDSPGFHTYCQKTSLAHSAVDILRAAKAYIGGDESGRAWRLDDRFFIAGYSEGGYAAMAALNELETQAKGEFPIEACYPMAGPFDMSGTMRVLMTGSDPIPSPYYLAFTVFGWRGNSGELLDPSALLEDSYLRRLRPMFDGRTSGRLINQAIAEMQGVKPGLAVAAAMLKPTVRAQLATPEGSALGLALLGVLRENDLYDWKADPSVTMTFMAAPRDELVPPINSTIAEAAMRARGATTRFIELKQTTHEKGGYEGYARTVLDIWERLAMGYP
ncbi:MAG: alpha/beta fold hydrolase, partial [Spirochaetota bacterium]